LLVFLEPKCIMTKMYYDRNLFTKLLKFFSLLHYEMFHTSNKRVIIIRTKLQLLSCFLSAAGDVWQRLNGYVLLTSTQIHTHKQTRARKGIKAEIL
jgi:hypothetical protein